MSDPTSAATSVGKAKPDLNPNLERQASHRRSSLRVILVLLPIWFSVSFGCGVLFRDWLDVNAPRIGHAPFGFWMAQQGAVICFVILLVVYALWMNRLDGKYNLSDGE